MSDQYQEMSRFELIHARQLLEHEQITIQHRLVYWQAFVRAAAALSREYSEDEPEISRYMTDLTVRAVQREREMIVIQDSNKLKMARVTDILRPPQTANELRDELAAVERDRKDFEHA